MAKMRSTQLETATSRLRLPVAKKPVYIRIAPSLNLGYRRNVTAGTWVARIADGKGGYSTKAIGSADDVEAADGNTVLTFWQAQDKARAVARGDAPDPVKPVTLADALSRYAADLKTRGADAGNIARVRKHLPAGLKSKAVMLVTVTDLRRWRDGLAKKITPSSVNRTGAALKAALNLCADEDQRITSRRAWEIGLGTIANAEQSRNVILSEATVRQIIVEARRLGAEFGLLVEVAAVTGARVSQLAKIEVQDLHADSDQARLSVPVSNKGKGTKAQPRRTVPIGAALAAKLRLAAAGRSATTPLLTKPSGEPWRKSDHSRPFQRAARAAGQDPAEVTIYALRHTSIVRMILANVPIRIVATLHDTSVPMIEKNYSRHIGDFSDALARGAMLDIADTAAEANVVPIRG
jgi:integrase